MFHKNPRTGRLEVDMSKVVEVSKYSILFEDGKELIIPQTLAKKVKEEWEESSRPTYH